MGKWMYNPVANTKDEKFDKCPYCGSKMRLVIMPEVKNGIAWFIPSKILFACDKCGCQSPGVEIDETMFDMKAVRDAIICDIPLDEEDEENE